MEIQGKVKLIKETETNASGSFSKKQIVVTTDEQYPQDIGIDFVQDAISKLDSIFIGQQVKVSVNIRGSEYLGKHYVNFQGWKIE